MLHSHTSTLRPVLGSRNTAVGPSWPSAVPFHSLCRTSEQFLCSRTNTQPSVLFPSGLNAFPKIQIHWNPAAPPLIELHTPQPSVNIAVNKNKPCHSGASLLGLKAKFSYWCLTSIHQRNRRLLYWPPRATEWQSPFLIDNISGW